MHRVELGYAVPQDCRALLSTMNVVATQHMSEGSYVYIGTENFIKIYYNITIIHVILLV